MIHKYCQTPDALYWDGECFHIIPIEERVECSLCFDWFMGLTGGRMRVQKLNMCLHKILSSQKLSLIKQLWSYLKYNHTSFFKVAEMTSVSIRGDFSARYVVFGQKVRRCMQLRSSVLITIQAAMANIYSAFTYNTCLHNDEVKK